MRTSVSVVIRCFNEAAHIGNLLQSLKGQTVADHEVVVVDSGSTDGTTEIASSFGANLVHIKPEEFSFGRSLNMGCKRAGGDVLLFASAHVLPVDARWIENIVTPFVDDAVGLVYGRQIGFERSKFSELEVFAKQFPADSNLDQKAPFCNNANCAIRRAIWLSRPYNESLTGLEDMEWAQWLLAQGRRIAYNAEAAVIHIHNETPSKIFRRYEREAIAMKRIFPDSHMTFIEFVSLLGANIFLDMARALKKGVLWKNAADILAFRLMQYWGTYRGFRFKSGVTREVIARFYYPRTPNMLIRKRNEVP